MVDKQQRIDQLIEKCLMEYPEARPCFDDWNRSWTEFKGEILVWFNVPLKDSVGMTTKAIREG